MFNQREAIVRLLQDDDPHTVGLVKEQLTERGIDAIPGLKDLLSTDHPAVTRHVREVLAQIDAREATVEFTLFASFFPENGDIETAGWLLTRALLPESDVAGARRQIDHWGERVAKITTGVTSAHERVRRLADFLGTGLNFRGNADDYYNPRNSLLSKLVDTRLGIPISLALLYIMVGKRANMEISGVNFPGHFLARHDDVLFDPFHRGRILGPAECALLLERQKLAPNPAYFKTATPLTMLTRILANLLHAYRNVGDTDLSTTISSWLRTLAVR